METTMNVISSFLKKTTQVICNHHIQINQIIYPYTTKPNKWPLNPKEQKNKE